MKWTFATAGLIIVGLFGITIIILFHEITVSNEQDYYTLKEATEASMIEAVDSAYYRLTGKIKISEEKFVESFTKRFIETSTYGQGNYYVDFYQITEYPAKVSLRIVDATNSYNIYTYNETVEATQTNIVNQLSAILDGYEIDDSYEVVRLLSSLTSGPPPVINGCTARKPNAKCGINPEVVDQFKANGLYDEKNIVITLDGSCILNVQFAPGLPPVQMVYNAIITCDSGYRLDDSGWCVC